jgi:hypothetical protein
MDPAIRELSIEMRNGSGNVYFEVDPAKASKTFFTPHDEETMQALVWEGLLPLYSIVPDYNKDTHKRLKLLTISDDLEIEYPEELHVHSLHRFSGKMAPLKGVKKLRLGVVSNSLDFNSTEVAHLVIERTILDSKPEKLCDYSDVFGIREFAISSKNPPCTIKCKGTIEVEYSNPGGTGEDGNGLIYDCPRLVVCDGRDKFTSTCFELVIMGEDSFCSEPASFKLPNLREVIFEEDE